MMKISHLICLIFISVIMVSCGQSGSEEPGPSKDRALLPREEWELSFANYKHASMDRERCEESGYIRTRTVDIVRYKGDMYIKGIFQDFPDSWIKGKVKNNTIRFESNQFLGFMENKPIFFMNGVAYCSYYFGNNPGSFIDFYPDDPLVFDISDKGNIISYDRNQWYQPEGPESRNGAFWYTASPHKAESEVCGLGLYDDYPDRDYMVNMCFRKCKK